MPGLDDAALDRLWDVLAERLQRNGLAVRGAVTLDGLDRGERHALAGLIGRPIDGDRVRLDLTDLDGRLRRTGGLGLVDVVVGRRGPLVDRPRRRTEATARRTAIWEAARLELASTGLASEPWVEVWLEAIRPVVGRTGRDPAALVVTAVRCVARLPGEDHPRGRTELASLVAGSSHALDDGTVLAALVLRAVALRAGVANPETPVERRALWARAGVLTDEVSTTVLTLGLRPSVESPIGAGIRARSDAGCESHLTIRDLHRVDRWVSAGTTVWVCENPRVLEAAMDAGGTAAMVCTSGNPTVVASLLLDRLVADGAGLRYRGDFDWPGLTIANRIISAHGADPWRMGRADYEAALEAAGESLVDLPRLEGRPVTAVWDPNLGPAMERAGRAIHEEALLEVLVADILAV